MNQNTVCYVGGCGRLGLSLAAWTAHKGFIVWCADINESAVILVNSGQSPISEPGVQELITQHHGTRLRATTGTTKAVLRSDLSFVIVPTPSLEDGSFSIEYVLAVCGEIGEALRQKDDYHVVVIVSTVMPGDTGGPIRDALEKASGKKAGPDFGLVYSPEFIRQGSIVHDFAQPDQLLIGQLDTKSGDAVSLHYAKIVENLAPQRRMSLISAEIAKLALNATVVTKLAQANQIAWLCQTIEGADAADVLGAVGSDHRIGGAYFRAGTPGGGPCFPRDCEAFAAAAKRIGSSLPITESVISFRAAQHESILRLVEKLRPDGGIVGLLGLTYKAGVDITEESAGLKLYESLVASGIDIITHDPGVLSTPLEICVRDSSLLVLTTPWPEFLALEEMDLTGKIILDLWGFLNQEKLNCKEYIRLGHRREQ